MRIVRAAAAAWLGIHALTVRAQDERWCERACRRSAVPTGTTRIVVDANTARVIEGSADLPERASVQLVFEGKNPFKYSYRFAVTSQPLDAAAAQVVLGRIPGLAGVGAGATVLPVPGREASPAIEANIPRNDCQAEVSRLNDLVNESVALASSVSRPAAIVDRYARFFDATDADDAFVEKTACIAWCSEAIALRATRGDRDVRGMAALSERVEQLGRDVEQASKDFDVAPCTTQERHQVEKAGMVEKLRRDAANYRTKLGEVGDALVKDADKIAALDRVLDRVVGDDTSFREARYPALSGEPTAVRAEVHRKPLRVADALEQPVGVVELRVGRGWLSLSGGVMVSWLTQRKVVRQTGNVADPGTPPQAGLVFGYENDSKMTVAPLLLLTANVYDLCPYATAGLSLGVIASTGTGGAPIEYFGGLTLALVHRRVFVSGGVHLGERERLAGGFDIGQQIPASVSDPLPTRRAWMASAAVAVTFALR